MARIAVVSDTHVPSRADEIPAWVADRVRAADYTIHAGENFTAVAGNMDPAALDLPEVATVEVEGVTFVVTHGTATTGEEYVATITEAVETQLDGEENAIAVAGHTHDLADDEMAGVRFLNPGSATGASPAERATMMEVEVSAGAVDVTVFEEGEEVGEA